MSETVDTVEKEEVVVENVDNNEAANELSEEGSGVAQILRLANMAGVVSGDEDVKKIVGKLSNTDTKAVEKKVEVEKTAESTEKKVDEAGNEIKAEEKRVETEVVDDPDDPFGLGSKKEVKSFNLKSEDEVKKFIEDQYAIKDYDTLFNSVNKWRADAGKQAEDKQSLDDLNTALANLPEPLKAGLNAYANSKDWHGAFIDAGGRISFDKDFSDHKKDTIVNHFFSDKMKKITKKMTDDEDYGQEEFDEAVNDLYDTSKVLYDNKKEDFESKRAALVDEENQKQIRFKESAVSSVESLKQVMPNFRANEVQSIQQRLVNGDLTSVFFNKDGSYKKDAAQKLALAIHGHKLLERVTTIATTAARSKATEDKVVKSKETLNPSKKQAIPNKTEVSNAISHLGSQFADDPYASVGQGG